MTDKKRWLLRAFIIVKYLIQINPLFRHMQCYLVVGSNCCICRDALTEYKAFFVR